MMKRHKLLLLLALSLPLLTQAQEVSDESREPAQNPKRKPLMRQATQNSKKLTVGDVLQSIDATSRGKNISIQKKALDIPAWQQQAKVNAAIAEVKPPKSTDLFRESGTDEEKLEGMTDQAIRELFNLTQKYSKSKNRGQLWLRLAEQYVEKSKYIELRVQREYDKKLELYNTKKGPRPRLDLALSHDYNLKAIKLYEWFLRDFPQDQRVDQALFFLGYNYMELDQFQKGVGYYEKLAKTFPNSPYVGEANFALGEYYFDNNKWKESYKAYGEVLKNRRARLYTFALFKMSWCLFRQARAQEGMKLLEDVVKLSRAGGQEDTIEGRKSVSRIRLGGEALKDLVLFYGESGNYKTAREYFSHVGGENAAFPMLEKLAYYYSDQGKKEQAEYIFKQLLERNPTAPKAFDYQYQIVQNYSTSKNQGSYRQELYTWIDSYGPESSWAQTNKDNKKLMEDSYTLRESALRNYTLLLHKNSQNSQKRADMQQAKEAYRLYLTKFGDSPKAVEMHFFNGELLYSMGEFDEAGKEYRYVADKDTKGKYYELAVLNSMLALEKGLKTDQQIKQMVGDKLESVPFSEAENTFISAAEKYITSFPRGEKAVDVKFKIGRLQYGYNHFDDALVKFRQIIAQYPKTPYAVYSANLILDIHNLRKDYDALSKDGSSLVKNSALVEQGFKTDVKDLVERAGFKKAQDLETAKNYESSAKAFADFVHQNPQSPLAVSAAYNAGINFERSLKTVEAIGMYQKVVSAPVVKGNEKIKEKTTLLLGRLFEQTGQYEKAAVLFEKYAKENPSDKLTPDLYYNAAVIWEGQKEYGRAIFDYEKYYQSARRKEKSSILFTVAKIHEKLGQNKAAQDFYERYVAAGDTEPDKVCEAYFRIAEIFERRGYKEEAVKNYTKTVAVQKIMSQRRKGAGLVWAAESKFRLIQKTYSDLIALKIPNNPQKQAEALKLKLALLTKLAQELSEVIKYDEANMVIASLTTLAKAYEHMAQALYSVPLPKDLNAQELEAYKKAFDQQAQPFVRQATDNYIAAINKSFEINAYNQWTKISLDAMSKRQPDKYFEPKEQVLTQYHTDDMGI